MRLSLRWLVLPSLVAAAPFLRAQQLIQLPAAGSAAAQFKQQELMQALRQKRPASSAAEIDRIATQFLDHLQRAAPIAADQLLAGKLDPDDLSARLDVFLEEHPELSGAPAAAKSTKNPRDRVADALRAFPDVARTDPERLTLADRFIDGLAISSQMARQALLSGALSDDELQSRVGVFAGNVRDERARAAVDPAVAAAGPVIDAFEKATFGNAADRPDAISYSGDIIGGATKRSVVIFEKRPNKLRIHVVENGIVLGILAFDGSVAWTESPGRPPKIITGDAAQSIASSARFDDVFVGYQDRGAKVRLEPQQSGGLLRLSLREPNGMLTEADIDPTTHQQTTRRTHYSNGAVEEIRLKDYRKVGPIQLPYTQERWIGGQLQATTHVNSVRLNPGLLDSFFSPPTNYAMGFMDFMGGLLALQAQAKAQPAPVLPPAKKGGS